MSGNERICEMGQYWVSNVFRRCVEVCECETSERVRVLRARLFPLHTFCPNLKKIAFLSGSTKTCVHVCLVS